MKMRHVVQKAAYVGTLWQAIAYCLRGEDEEYTYKFKFNL